MGYWDRETAEPVERASRARRSVTSRWRRSTASASSSSAISSPGRTRVSCSPTSAPTCSRSRIRPIPTTRGRWDRTSRATSRCTSSRSTAGKRSIGVRLATDEGRAVVEDLVRNADVVIDNYRPGVLAKFGLGPRRAARGEPRGRHVLPDRLRRDRPRREACRVRLHDPGARRSHEPRRRARRASDEGRHLLRRPQRGDHRRARGVRGARGACADRDGFARRPRALRRADLHAHVPRVVAAQPRRRLRAHRELRASVAGAGAELPHRRRPPRAVRRQRRHVATVRGRGRRPRAGERTIHDPRGSARTPRRGDRRCAARAAHRARATSGRPAWARWASRAAR